MAYAFDKLMVSELPPYLLHILAVQYVLKESAAK